MPRTSENSSSVAQLGRSPSFHVYAELVQALERHLLGSDRHEPDHVPGRVELDVDDLIDGRRYR
jgi:hypothetical protein